MCHNWNYYDGSSDTCDARSHHKNWNSNASSIIRHMPPSFMTNKTCDVNIKYYTADGSLYHRIVRITLRICQSVYGIDNDKYSNKPYNIPISYSFWDQNEVKYGKPEVNVVNLMNIYTFAIRITGYLLFIGSWSWMMHLCIREMFWNV